MPCRDFFTRSGEVLRILLLERVPRPGQFVQFQRDYVPVRVDSPDGQHLSQSYEISYRPLVFGEIAVVASKRSRHRRTNPNVARPDQARRHERLAASQVPNLPVAFLMLKNRMQA